MTKTILIAGGYGVVGSQIARHLRTLMPTANLILAGRNPDKATELVTELGPNTSAVALETTSPDATLSELTDLDAIVCALQDPQDKLLKHALNNGIAHLSITRSVTDMAGLAAHIAHAQPTAPIVPIAHWQAGILTLAALDLAAGFKEVSSIKMSALFDMADPIGPMTMEDAGHFFGKALIVRDDSWTWIDPDDEAAPATIDAETFDARPMSVLDTTSLRAATGAADISFHLGMGTSRGTRAGKAASHDMKIAITGTSTDGQTVTRTRLVSDPRGQAQLTATGAALATCRAINDDGGDGNTPAPAPGLQMPETILDPAQTMQQLTTRFGITIEDEA